MNKSLQFRLPIEREDMKLNLDKDSHVETIALLQKRRRKSKSDTYVKFSLDMEDYYRIMDAEGGAKNE